MSLFLPEIKHNVEAQSRVRAWIERLKSDRDEQAKLELHPNPGQFCCLGVAIDELEPNEWVRVDGEAPFSWHEEEFYLPRHFVKAYCLYDEFGTFRGGLGDGHPRSLIQLNNDRTLVEIGEFIERELEAALTQEAA